MASWLQSGTVQEQRHVRGPRLGDHRLLRRLSMKFVGIALVLLGMLVLVGPVLTLAVCAVAGGAYMVTK